MAAAERLPDRWIHVPEELRELDQWVIWRWETRDGKRTKAPYNAGIPVRRASSTDPDTWRPFDLAVQCANETPTVAGIGFVFSPDDPFCGIDFDHALSETGEIAGWAQDWIKQLGGYQEISPSGKGIKAIVRASVKRGRKTTGKGTDGAGGIEVYSSARFFTITGQSDECMSIPDRQDVINRLLRLEFPKQGSTTPKAGSKKPVILSLIGNDSELIDRARAADNGSRFQCLFDRGDTSGHNGDDSSADLALCNMLAFWTGGNPDQMDRIFRQSALMRSKWDESRGQWTYGQITIDKALSGRTEFYSSDYGGGAKEAKKANDPRSKVDSRDSNGTSSASFASFAPSEEDAPVTIRSWPEPPGEAAYHGPVGAFIRAVDPYTEADPIGVLGQMLAAVGNIVGRGPHWTVGATRHGLNLFLCTAGPTSSGRKGTAKDVVLLAADEIDTDWKSHCVKGGLASGEGLKWAVRDAIVKRIPIKRDGILTGQFEEEMTDPGVDDKRLFVIETEFGGTLKIMSREGNSLSSVIRQAWDDGNLRSLTKNDPAQSTGAHISIVAHVTEQEVNRFMNGTEAANGFGNRFIWLSVRRSKRLPYGAAIPNDILERYVAPIRQAINVARNQIGGFDRSEAFDAEWANLYCGELDQAKPGLLGSILGRAEPQVMRLACIYALLDQTAQIDRVHLDAAMELWRYSVRSAEYIFGDQLGDLDAEKVLSALKSRPEGMSQTEISVEVFAKHKPRSQIARVLGRLLESNLVFSEVVPTSGRPSTVWFYGNAKQADKAKKGSETSSQQKAEPTPSPGREPKDGSRERLRRWLVLCLNGGDAPPRDVIRWAIETGFDESSVREEIASSDLFEEIADSKGETVWHYQERW